MKLAIATVCLSGTLDEKLAAIAAAGFTGVELFENDLLSFSGAPADVRRMAEDQGLKIRRVDLGQLLQQRLRRGVAGLLARCLVGVLVVLCLIRRVG